MRFGRLHPAQSSSVQAKPHVMSAIPYPPECLRGDIQWTPSLVHNTEAPTCTTAGLINSARMWALVKGGFDLVADDDKLLEFYAGCVGCAPTLPAIDATQGAIMQDVLQRAESHGFDVGPQVLVPLFEPMDHTNLAALRQAIFLNGSVYVGVDLRESDLTGPWTGAASGAIVGGHCIAPFGYSSNGFRDATWGRVVECDDEWLASRIVEAYSVTWALAMA